MPSLSRSNEARTPTAGLGKSKWQKAKDFFIVWIKRTWVDLFCMAVLGAITLTVFLAPIPATRTFPITFDKSGDIIYPEWAYPFRGWIIKSWLSGLISIAGPMLIYLVAQIRIKSAWDASNAILGTTGAVVLASLFQVIIKQLIGGFRPWFLDVCMPDISRAKTHNTTGLNGVGFQKVMYTIDVCTQPNKRLLKTAITSFPSGHTTAAFAGFGFLFLWLNAKLKVWADHKPAFWKLTLTILPVLGAVMIACSLTIDAAHNWYDIVAGAFIGCFVALASYRTSYAAIWDWRFNHIPLQQEEAFCYGFEGDRKFVSQTLAGSAGWGNVDNKKAWPHSGLDSAASSAIFARRTSGIQQVDDDINGSGQPTQRRAPVGDDIV